MPRVYNHEAGHDAEILPTLRGYQSLLDPRFVFTEWLKRRAHR
jgi:hypothetical protein